MTDTEQPSPTGGVKTIERTLLMVWRDALSAENKLLSEDLYIKKRDMCIAESSKQLQSIMQDYAIESRTPFDGQYINLVGGGFEPTHFESGVIAHVAISNYFATSKEAHEWEAYVSGWLAQRTANLTVKGKIDE